MAKSSPYTCTHSEDRDWHLSYDHMQCVSRSKLFLTHNVKDGHYGFFLSFSTGIRGISPHPPEDDAWIATYRNTKLGCELRRLTWT